MTVEVEVRGPVAIVQLKWPEKRNSLGPADAREVATAIDAAVTDTASALVLTGDGAFCSGGDLRTFSQLSQDLDQDTLRGQIYGEIHAIVRSLKSCPVPTIAAIDGAAVGLGFDIALACDMRFVGPNGWLQHGWSKAGLIAGAGGVLMLRRLSPELLWRLLADQPRLNAPAATQLGLGEDSGTASALDAAVARGVSLSRIPRDVLSAYVALQRHEGSFGEHLEMSADYQARFIGSQRFRDLTKSILGDGS